MQIYQAGSPGVVVPLPAAGMIPALPLSFAMPSPPAATGPVGTADEALIASLIGPLVVDPAAITANALNER